MFQRTAQLLSMTWLQFDAKETTLIWGFCSSILFPDTKNFCNIESKGRRWKNKLCNRTKHLSLSLIASEIKIFEAKQWADHSFTFGRWLWLRRWRDIIGNIRNLLPSSQHLIHSISHSLHLQVQHIINTHFKTKSKLPPTTTTKQSNLVESSSLKCLQTRRLELRQHISLHHSQLHKNLCRRLPCRPVLTAQKSHRTRHQILHHIVTRRTTGFDNASN